MAYTQSVLERELMKNEGVKVGAPWRLLIMGFIVFGTSVGIFLGMRFGFQPFLQAQVNKEDQKIKQLLGSLTQDEVKNSQVFYSQLININDLIESRSLATPLLEMLEKNTLKGIYFNSMNYSNVTKELKLSGVGPTYAVLAQQLEIFKNYPGVEKTFMDNASVDERTKAVQFSIRVKLKK